MPEIYAKLNPLPYGDSQFMEVDLTIWLQNWVMGFGKTPELQVNRNFYASNFKRQTARQYGLNRKFHEF